METATGADGAPTRGGGVGHIQSINVVTTRAEQRLLRGKTRDGTVMKGLLQSGR